MSLNKAGQPIRWKERIGTVIIGHTAKQVEETIFDYVLYPAVIAGFGMVMGGLIMSSLSASVCYFYLVLYDSLKKDWFGFELLKRIRDGEEMEGRVASIVQKIARKSDWMAFLALSYYTDPFMTTIYLRKGAEKYDGFSPRDFGIFWASVIVTNLWWTLVVSGAIEVIRAVLHWFGRN